MSVLNSTRMLPRITPMFLLICSLLVSSYVLGAPTQEPLLRISVNEACPEKCMCMPTQDEPGLQDVICPPENYLNDEPPPEDASVQDLVDFVDTAVVKKTDNIAPEETSVDTNDDTIQDASVEVNIITNMETKVPDNNAIKANEPKNVDDVNVDDDVVPEVTKNDDVNNASDEVEGTSDEKDNADYDDPIPIEEKVKEVDVQEATAIPAENDYDNEVMQGDQPQEDTPEEGAGEEEEEGDLDDTENEEEEKPMLTETPAVINAEVPEEITGDDNVAIVAKKGPAPEEQNTDEGAKYEEGDSDEASDEEEEEEKPVETLNNKPQGDTDSDKENKGENEGDDALQVLATDTPPVAESEVKPAESDKIVDDEDFDSDEVPDSHETDSNTNSDDIPAVVPDQQYDSKNMNTDTPKISANSTGSIILQRIQSFDSGKNLNSDIDNIILSDGEILFNPDQMDDAMSGKMISEGGEGSTQPQQSTASWVILGLIMATFVGVIGYATVRGKMDKKNEAALARVTPSSIPTSNEIKMNRKPNIQGTEGTEMKVLSRPLLQPAEEESITREFKDDNKNLQQVVIADISDGIPYIDDSDGGQRTKPVNPVVKPARKRAPPPPPINVPSSSNAPSDTIFSPTTPTLVRTRIVDNSPQIARVLRNPNNNPFDE